MHRLLPIAAALAFSQSAPAAASTLVVGNKGEDTVSLIHLESGEEKARINTGPQPHEVAVSPDGARAAVVAYGGNTIEIIDIASARAVATLMLEENARPHGLLWLPDGRLVATAEGVGALIIADPAGEGAQSIATGQERSHLVAVSPDGARAYVTNVRSGTVSVIDLAAGQKIADLPSGQAPEGLALSPDGRELWVAERDGDRVRIFDTERLLETGALAVGARPIRILIAPGGKTAVTSNFLDGSLTLIDVASRRVSATIVLEGGAESKQVTIMASADGRRVYVAETGRNTVAEVDLEKKSVIRRIATGRMGDGLALSPVDVSAP